MVKLSGKARSKKGNETVSLINAPKNPKHLQAATAIASASASTRQKYVLGAVLFGVLLLFVIESIEWGKDSNQAVGDVQLKKGGAKTGEEIEIDAKPIDAQDDITKKAVDETETKEKITPAATEVPAPPPPATETPVPPPPAATEPPATETPAPPPPAPAANNANSADCSQQCANAAYDASRFDGQDLTVAATMRARLQAQRQKWIDNTMKPQYGDYYDQIFTMMDPVTNQRVHIGKQQTFKPPNMLNLPGQKATDTSGIGWTRMVSKYQMKLLQVQLGMLEEKLNPQGYCQIQCAPPTEGHKMQQDTFARFTWVNGGHSASAGHGNFYEESYTANLGTDVTPVMKGVGLDWQVRNYAMGGTESGEEVALCHNSIFGKDVDSLSWDYGMCDGHEHNKIALYAYRTARLSQQDTYSQPGNIKHRPSLIGLHHNDDVTELLHIMQGLGMTVLGMDRPLKSTVEKSFPDMFGMSDAEIQALPPMVKYMRCQEKIEAGEPGCQDNKYNDIACPKRRAKASWHPGLKYHALIGHLLAHTVLEVFDQALEQMVNAEPPGETLEAKKARIEQKLRELDAAEQASYDNIFNSPIHPKVLNWFEQYQWKGDNKERHKAEMSSFPLQWLIRQPVMCHTAMLPAEIRYKGILTENFDKVGTVLDGNYEKALFQHDVIAAMENPPQAAQRQAAEYKYDTPGKEGLMLLAAKDDERDRDCELMTNADNKDFFYVSSAEDWRHLVLPNDAEKAYYTEFNEPKGYIFFCMAKCDWGNCPQGDIRKQVMEFSKDPEYGGITIEINLVKVTSQNCMNSCCAVKHDHPEPNKQFIWQPNAEGKYDIRAKIDPGNKYGYARFSSFILL